MRWTTVVVALGAAFVASAEESLAAGDAKRFDERKRQEPVPLTGEKKVEAVITTIAPKAGEETSTTTTIAPESTTTGIGNPAILGCQWPQDFKTRYAFCLKKAGLEAEKELSDQDIKWGLLDPDVLKELMGSCDKDNLSQCVKAADEAHLAAFVQRWRTNEDAYRGFQTCLQENTEAMNRLCGGDSQVGRVVSGAAGLQLNLIAAMDRVLDQGNVSDACASRLAQTVHQTAALYLSTEHFMDNAVLCWNVVNKACPAHCSAFAAQLKCLKDACPSVQLPVFQELGIWQWYYLNAPRADRQCSLKDSQCSSIEVLLAICVSTVLAFLATVAALCGWRYGLCGAQKRKLRYSRLDVGEEGRGLTSLPEECD